MMTFKFLKGEKNFCRVGKTVYQKKYKKFKRKKLKKNFLSSFDVFRCFKNRRYFFFWKILQHENKFLTVIMKIIVVIGGGGEINKR